MDIYVYFLCWLAAAVLFKFYLWVATNYWRGSLRKDCYYETGQFLASWRNSRKGILALAQSSAVMLKEAKSEPEKYHLALKKARCVMREGRSLKDIGLTMEVLRDFERKLEEYRYDLRKVECALREGWTLQDIGITRAEYERSQVGVTSRN